MNKRRAAVITCLVVAIIGATLWAVKARQVAAEREAANAVLKDARSACGNRFGDLDDNDTTLIVTAKRDFHYDKVACILRELEIPASVGAKVADTRAIDGRQEATWDRITASWTFHPDSGMKMILELEPVE